MWCCVEVTCCIYTHNFVSAVTVVVLMLVLFSLSSSLLVTVIHMYYSRFSINLCRNF